MLNDYIFPQAPERESSWWMQRDGNYKAWRDFSLEYCAEIIELMQPQTIMVFGQKAKHLLQKHRDLVLNEEGVGMLAGVPSVYCPHLSWRYGNAKTFLPPFQKLRSLIF